MALYNVHFVHKISSKPAPLDSVGPIGIADNAFADAKALGRALRKVGILCSGESVRNFRVEGANKVVVFPNAKSVWHAFIIQPAIDYTPAGIDYPGYGHLRKAVTSKQSQTADAPVPVIFRVEDGDALAIFPTIPGSPGMIQCYSHFGQHASGAEQYFRTLRLAKPEQYKALKAELEGAPYNYKLKVVKRITPQMRAEFRKNSR